MRVKQRSRPGAREIGTVFGVYDLVSRRIGVPGRSEDWVAGLVDAPKDGPSVMSMLHDMAAGPFLTHMLDA
jgi:hypothetical protein